MTRNSVANDFFRFKEFTIYQDKCAFKVGTDGVLLGAAADVSSAGKILDIGSGTGLISIMVAQRCSGEIVAIEPDVKSFVQLYENVRDCKWSNRIDVVNSALQSFKTNSRFDLILSNPPYFISSLKNPDHRKSVARHNDTLSHQDLLSGVEELMTLNGKFQVILPFNEGMKFIRAALEKNLFCNDLMKIQPSPGSEIKRVIITLSRQKRQVHESVLIIETGERHEYSEEYKNLTKDFYLNF